MKNKLKTLFQKFIKVNVGDEDAYDGLEGIIGGTMIDMIHDGEDLNEIIDIILIGDLEFEPLDQSDINYLIKALEAGI